MAVGPTPILDAVSCVLPNLEAPELDHSTPFVHVEGSAAVRNVH